MTLGNDSNTPDPGAETLEGETNGAVDEFLFDLYCSPSRERIMRIQDSLQEHSPEDVANFYRELRDLKSRFANYVSGPPPQMEDSDRSQAVQELETLLVGWERSAAAMSRPDWRERIQAAAKEACTA